MSKKERKSYDKVKAEVDALNEKFKVGEVISLKKDDGSFTQDTITNEFTIMCGQATAWLDKHRSFMANRVYKLKK